MADAAAVIRAAQEILARYLEPDSGIRAEDALVELAGVLDGPAALAITRPTDNKTSPNSSPSSSPSSRS